MESKTKCAPEQTRFHDAFLAMVKAMLPESAAISVHMFMYGYNLGVATALSELTKET